MSQEYKTDGKYHMLNQPLKCHSCMETSKRPEIKTTLISGGVIAEADLYCGKCGKYINSWGYGFFNNEMS